MVNLLKNLFKRKESKTPPYFQYGDHNRPCTCHGPGDDFYEIMQRLKENDN